MQRIDATTHRQCPGPAEGRPGALRESSPGTGRSGLPRYSPFRRLSDWEPRDGWLSAGPQLSWPDTVLGPTVVRWLPRILLVVTVALCALTIGSVTSERVFWILFGVALVTAGWQELWMRWSLQRTGQRVLAFGVQWALGLTMVLLNPLASFFCFTGFMIAGTFFTGGPLILATLLVGMQVSLGQIGGSAQLATSGVIYLVLVVVNFSIALAFITLSNRREEAVANRDAAVRELIVTQQANEELQEQLVRSAHETGIRDERARLARELHDTVAQSLVAVITQLEAIDDRALTDGPRARVERSTGLAREALTEARRAVNALSPAALQDGQLPEVISGLLADRLGPGPIGGRVRVEGWPRRTAHDAVLIRVCQEALSNICTHSGAREVTITLTYLDDETLLDVADDGVGFDPLALPRPSASGGHGLPGMAERVQLAGGRLTVESEPGAGTVISAAVPG